MNDTASTPTRDYTRCAYRRAQARNHEIFRAYREIELSGAGGSGSAALECEIEFYRVCEAIPATANSPAEPAEYAIASITAVEYAPNGNGFRGTTPTPLPTPAWLEELLIDCVDEDSLAEDAQ